LVFEVSDDSYGEFMRFLRRVIEKENEIANAQERSNRMLDKSVLPIEDNMLSVLQIDCFDLQRCEYSLFVKSEKLAQYSSLDYPHKKLLEFFFSYRLLDIQQDDILLDAAGGDALFLKIMHEKVGCRCLLNDHMYLGVSEKDNLRYIGGDVCSINLPEASVTKISCNHSFEHFHENKDSGFIREVSRLLKPGGEAVILPLFLSGIYFETWNKPTDCQFDSTAETLVDETATLPGSGNTGFFARVYDDMALQKRVLTVAKETGLFATIYRCLLDGADVPDMNKNSGALINNPMRAIHFRK
jgi:ubiquinone/menaquinone biosynthesis C-methylase UbiE